MTQLKHELLEGEFTQILSNPFAKVLMSKNKPVLICEAVDSYIPIEEFKTIFNSCSSVIRNENIKKFVFDKRALTTFHQPSMEWYFLTWKREMLQLGLSSHRKVLPPLPWFRECVAACKSRMLENKEHTFLKEIDVKYYDTVKECVDN